MTFWMFLSKERNSVKADRFLLWDNVVSMYHIDIVILWHCGHAGQWEQDPLNYHEHLQTLSRRKLLCEPVGTQFPAPAAMDLLLFVLIFFFWPSSLFLFLTFIYLLLLEVVYIFETMLTLHLLIKLYLNKLHMLITE